MDGPDKPKYNMIKERADQMRHKLCFLNLKFRTQLTTDLRSTLAFRYLDLADDIVVSSSKQVFELSRRLDPDRTSPDIC